MSNDMFITASMTQCLKSTYKWRLGAVVVYKNKIVGRGYNKVHSIGDRLDGKHAEIEAIYNTRAKYRKGSTMYVCRLNKRGELRLAKPCDACMPVIRKVGVKYVWYSSDDGWHRMAI